MHAVALGDPNVSDAELEGFREQILGLEAHIRSPHTASKPAPPVNGDCH